MTVLAPRPLLAVAAGRGSAADAGIRELDGRLVGWFRLDGGKHRGALGTAEGETIERLVRSACDAGVPVVGVLATSGADLTEGVASLHAWGRVARALADASGLVPIVLCVVGPCVVMSGASAAARTIRARMETPPRKLGVRYQRLRKPRPCAMTRPASPADSAMSSISRTAPSGRGARARRRLAGRRARP